MATAPSTQDPNVRNEATADHHVDVEALEATRQRQFAERLRSLGGKIHWMRSRSGVAIDAAAALIRSRGGDVAERFEFARLFATGEPQEGLDAFLAKRRPRFAS